MTHRILVCDDEADIRESLSILLRDEGFEVVAVASGKEAVVEAAESDVVLLDIKMAGQDGLETLSQIRSRNLSIPVVMISGHADVRTAVDAIRAGANDLLEKPLSSEQVLQAVRRVLDASRLSRENAELRRRLGLTRIVGSSSRIKRLLSEIERAAPTQATVLVRGPSGTGKELVARALHEASLVRSGPFVQVNCAAIPESLIESELFGHERGSFTGAERKQIGKFIEADGGTIFLDEVGDMSASTQAKVLRVLQEGEVEPVGSPRVVKVKVRVVAATNRDLEAMIRSGSFREDLYYRLAVLELQTPPLSEHPEDVPELVLFFAAQFARTANYRPKRFTDAALQELAGWPWPGNVRELKNLVERVMIMSDRETIDVPQLNPTMAVVPRETIPIVVRDGRVVRSENEAESAPPEVPSHAPVWEQLVGIQSLQAFQDAAESLFLSRKLSEYGGNVTRTAEAIGTPRSNLYKKIDRYGLKRERPGSPVEASREPGGNE